MSDRTGNGSKTLRRYNVRDDKEWLGLFVIGDDGYFSTVSGYGNYAYFWSHAGEDFRRFLCDVDSCYLLGKLCGRRDEYDGKATVKAVKRHILEQRRSGGFDREEARKEWDILSEHSQLEAREWFGMWVGQTEIGDAPEFAVYEYPSDARWFAKRVMPAFQAMLRAELAAEKAHAAAEVPS
jgi:hypothetical protein